ncbi:Rrf2 family transcriptional regulator [Candidatus Saganbacteria bacterium]|nr:Rrf2 family transcriptional regulator [Candidatus Saganbacteria bacterium]
MKLTRASDFAVRILKHLAGREGEATSRELSRKLHIPYNHLAKVVQKLSRGGYLKTKKGKGGGIELACEPKTINLFDVIESVEGPLQLSHCILHRKSCAFSRNCGLRRTLALAEQTLKKTLASRTIYDLAAGAI